MGGGGMGSLDFGFRAKGRDFGNFSTGGASHLIRSAEKLAASGRYDFAIEQLSVAERLDPGNQYIHAIIDRIRVLQNSPQTGNSLPENRVDRSSPLSITVGPQFKDGIRSIEDDPSLTSEDIHTKIRFLTNMAEKYLESGSSDKAFDSLMRAYLLDPLSPYVIASEKTVLPAWESAKTQTLRTKADRLPDSSTSGVNNLSNAGITNMARLNNNSINNSQFAGNPGQASAMSPDEQLRMEMLKQQKEHERLEKERVVWREASKPQRTFGEDDPMIASTSQPTSEQAKPQPTGLFSKLRLGKFLE